MNPAVAFYFNKAQRWLEEVQRLRALVLRAGLTEELKWGVPCYTFQGKNVVLIHVFKDYCALLFFKGTLLQDANGLLVQQTPNTQATRQLRFTTVGDLRERESVISTYLTEAIEVEKAGLQVPLKKVAEFPMPAEFHQKLAETPALKQAFQTLTPGRQRAYLLYFSAPKQAATRAARVEKCQQQILHGKGLNE